MSADNQQESRERITLHPQYLLGFVDGEGSFHIAIYKDARMKAGVKFIPEFHVSQRVESAAVLREMVKFFGCGYVKANHATNPKDQTMVYVVRDRKDLLQNIIPFFEKHYLQTMKRNDFIIFADIVKKMDVGMHRTPQGAKALLEFAYRMNGGGKYRRHKHHIL